METLIQRLVANPHDEEALAYAHRAGTQDPRSYAILLEKVGSATADPAYAAHWLSEAANVWSTTIGDAHHAARTLMIAIEKDPTQRTAAERLAQLYREKGDQKALIALLERLVKSLTPLLFEKPEVRTQLANLHEELGKLWSEPPLARPERALENWRRLAELDPQNAYAIYAAREMLKGQQQYAEAIPYFAMEQALVDDPDRKLALLRDEADIRRRAGDLAGATVVLRSARSFLPEDVGLTQELGLVIVDRIESGEPVPQLEREESAELFVTLAEMYDGEYGLSYSISALRASPGNDRAMQLADHYAKQLNRAAELAPRYAAYLQANPNGFMSAEARVRASVLPPPPASSGSNASIGASAPPASAAPAQPGEPAPHAFAPTPTSSTPQDANARELPRERSSSSVSVVGAAAAAPALLTQPGTVPPEVMQLLEEAHAESQKGRRPQALVKFREVLKVDPANPDALSWVEEHLRQKRMYADLRDVLLAASRVATVAVETRKAQLRDVAGLCESQLRDIETSIQAWKQICQLDRNDEQARDQLRRLLERGARWDDLAALLDQEAMATLDVEQKIALEKRLAALHEQKRRDPIAAAEAWARIASLSPEDDGAIQCAVKLYERGERFDLAAQVLTDTASGISEKLSRGPLLQKLGELRMKLEEPGAAGAAYADAAELLGQAKLWELAEKAYMTAGRPADAANALSERAQLSDGKARAVLHAQAADLLLKAGDLQAAIDKLERSVEIDPANDTYAGSIEELYRRTERLADLVRFLLTRAEKLGDKARRIAARRSAADVQRTLGDRDGARESLLLLLSDGDDADALAKLVEDADERRDHQTCVALLRRLGALMKSPADKLVIALREARILADGLDDVEAAIDRYEAIYKSLDPRNRTALGAIAELEEKRGNQKGAANALEREILLAEGTERVELAQRLAALYEGALKDPRGAIKALEIIHAAEPDDFDAIARLQRLAEQVEDWPRVVSLIASLIEVEGDEDEASKMTRHLSGILDQKLGKGDEALACLERLADQGDGPCREAYIELGDRLGWKGIVATKLVAWNESTAAPSRNAALRGAFDRFVEIGRGSDAARVAMELARSRSADAELASKLEAIATQLKDLDALGVAHDILAKDLSGTARAAELVRQAEVRVTAGGDALEAMNHGEVALTSVLPAEVEPFLSRLAALTPVAGQIIDLYERQVSRCRVPADRLAALARAAQVACERGANDRARSFFELALGGGVQEETIITLEGAASAGDERAGGIALRSILAEALASGGQGSRDGGRTRAALLRRAATVAHRDLNDIERAFNWLGDALITHVDDASLEALEALGRTVGDMLRVAATLSRALDEVFDGPLVRKLLLRRARLRRDVLGDRQGASVDLKKLHDLSPSDLDVMNDLSGLLMELGDHRGMIQLYEDQILRGRDPAQRAELARKVAHIWEEEIGDAREAADAWRRVLRMKSGDPEATAGLERAKSGKLRRTAPPPVPTGPSRPPTEPPQRSRSEAPDTDARAASDVPPSATVARGATSRPPPREELTARRSPSDAPTATSSEGIESLEAIAGSHAGAGQAYAGNGLDAGYPIAAAQAYASAQPASLPDVDRTGFESAEVLPASREEGWSPEHQDPPNPQPYAYSASEGDTSTGGDTDLHYGHPYGPEGGHAQQPAGLDPQAARGAYAQQPQEYGYGAAFAPGAYAAEAAAPAEAYVQVPATPVPPPLVQAYPYPASPYPQQPPVDPQIPQIPQIPPLPQMAAFNAFPQRTPAYPSASVLPSPDDVEVVDEVDDAELLDDDTGPQAPSGR